MSWMNQNTSKKVFTITRPLEEEAELRASIPEDAVITAIKRSTKTVSITYVMSNVVTLEDIQKINATIKPIKFDRTGAIKYNDSKTKRIHCTERAMAILNVADFHLNRLIYGDECYGQDYNLEKASNLFIDIINEAEIRLRSNAYNLDKIILNTCGDFLNSDTINGTTTAGTMQFNDVTWKKVYAKAATLLEYAIARLSTIAPVYYYYVKGNHDEQVGFYLTTWLNARFLNEPNVFINDSPKPRHVINYGNNIIIITHGETEAGRAIDLPFMEPESIERLSQASNIEVLSGHLHSNQVSCKNGVRWEVLSSACPVQDTWTYGKGYDGLRQEASIIYYNNDCRVQQDIINTKLLFERRINNN